MGTDDIHESGEGGGGDEVSGTEASVPEVAISEAAGGHKFRIQYGNNKQKYASKVRLTTDRFKARLKSASPSPLCMDMDLQVAQRIHMASGDKVQDVDDRRPRD
jgi:hypothetical protein